MAEKFLNQTGLQIYNDALQAKIAENYATKEYVNSVAGSGGLSFKIVDRLPGSLIPIKDTMGMDLSGKTLVTKFNMDMNSVVTNPYVGKATTTALVTTTNSSITEGIGYSQASSGGAL